MNNHLVKSGLRLSAISIVWTVFSSISSIIVGLASHSLVLVAFGMTGALDAAGSVSLLLHFRHALKHDKFSEHYERIAFLVVNTGLIVVALFTAIESVQRLINKSHSESSGFGLAVAGASLGILGVLAVRKRRVGAAIPSAALSADGVLSATGALLAVVTIVGSALSDAGWWWADPTAAALVAAGALSIGVVLKVRN